MTDITRRTALKAAPAVALTAAMPAMAAVEPESEIMRRFRDCVAYRDWFNSPGSPDDEDGSVIGVLGSMEAEACALPARTMQELAAKVTLWSSYGDDSRGGLLDELVLPEVLSLAGFPIRDGSAPSTPPESEIMRLFREYVRLSNLAAAAPHDGAGDVQAEAFWCQRDSVEDRIMALPSVSAVDVAVKVLVETRHGECDVGPRFRDEMIRITGVEGPSYLTT